MGGLKKFLKEKKKKDVISQIMKASKKYCQTLLEIGGTEFNYKPVDCIEPEDDRPLPQSIMFYLLLHVLPSPSASSKFVLSVLKFLGILRFLLKTF